MFQRRDMPEGVDTGEGMQWNMSVAGRVVAIVNGSGISLHSICTSSVLCYSAVTEIDGIETSSL